MGFYSFYRIFKDIIKSIFGNKAWRYTLIIALIVIVFTVYSTKVNAEELHDFVVDYYTTYHYTQGSYNHQLVFVPVFANSSYAISWASGNSVTFSFIDNLTRENSAISVPMSTISTNDQGSFGYFATKDGYLVLDHYSTDFSHPTYTITTDYDYTSNLATIHQDLQTLIAGPVPSTTLTGLLGYIGGGQFINNANYNTIYLPIDKDTTYNVSFNATPGTSFNSVAFGSTSSVPAVGVAFTDAHYGTYYNNSTSFSFKGSDYQYRYFVITYHKDYFSNFKVTTGSNVMTTITNEASATRDTMTDSNISQNSSDYTLPTDSTNDITNDGFTSIFDRIRSTFTTGASTPAVINVPFTNKSFTISKASVFGSANLGIVQSIIEAFWWFVVSVFIVKDIFKKIEKIKTGNIEFTETTNIKEDIL